MSRQPDPRRRQVETLFAGGWKATDIHRIMGRDGSKPPALLTIRRWTEPEFEERTRAHGRNHMRRKRRLTHLDRLTEAEMWDLAVELTR